MNFEGIDVSKLPPPRNSGPMRPRMRGAWKTDKPVTWADGTTWTDFNEPIPFVRPELQSERLSKCYTCDSLDRVNMLCLKCHCMVLAKSKFHDANCPINKW